MKKKIIGIISVVVSCIVYGITKHFFDKDREKEREEENKMIHDSVEKIFSESRDKRMEKLDLEFEKEMEKIRKKHEELVKKSMDMTLSPEENLQASIELARLNGVPEDEIIKTPEEGKKYFTD